MHARLISNLQLKTEDDELYNLYSGNTAKLLYLDGVGMPPIRRILQEIPQRDGAVDRGFRLAPRRMSLALYIDEVDELAADRKHDLLTRIFGPTTSPLRLRATKLDGTVREIECYVDGELDYPQSRRVGSRQELVVPLIAPDPTWYYPGEITFDPSLSSGTAVVSHTAIGYTADDWPTFAVTGPATDLLIVHSPTDDTIELDGTIPDGETWTFDLRPGQKTLRRNSDGANRLSFVTTASIQGFDTMRFVNEKLAAIYAQDDNVFTFTATGVSGASAVLSTHYRRFLSL